MLATISTRSARMRPSWSSATSAVVDMVAALRVGEEMLAAVGDPLHRPAELLRRLHRQRIFPVVEALWCRSRRRHPGSCTRICLRIDLQDLAERVAHAMDALRADVRS